MTPATPRAPRRSDGPLPATPAASGHSQTQPQSNGYPSTPSTSRFIKKLALRGQAFAWGAKYQLYLRVTLPESASTQTLSLIPDTHVKLTSWHVDALTSSGGYPPLQESAARAAGFLGIPMSTSGGVLDQGPHPRISVANYSISLVVPAQVDSRSYLVTLNLETGMVIQPPRSPYEIHLFVPRCLHSRIRFTFAPEVAQEEANVHVEPPLGGKRPHKARRSIGSPLSEACDDDAKSIAAVSEDSHEPEDAEDDSTLVVRGLFPSTERLVIRWTAADAGKLHRDDDLPALLCDSLQTTTRIKYASQEGSDPHKAQVELNTEVTLKGAYCAGISPVACFPLTLETFGQDVECLDVSIDQNKILRSWHFLGFQGESQSHNKTPSSTSPTSGASTPSLLEDASETASLDGDDLLATRPPKGIDASMDLSMDTRPTFTATPPAARGGGDESQAPVRALLIYIDTAAVYGTSAAELAFVVRCRLGLTFRESTDPESASHWLPILAPLLKGPTAGAHRSSTSVERHPAAAKGRIAVSRSPYREGEESLQFEAAPEVANPGPEETFFLQQLDETQEATLGDDTVQETSPHPGTPQAVVRPLPVYDAITLQDDESSRPFTISSVHVTFWLCGQGKKLRIFAQMESAWPTMHDGHQPEEIDLWLPRISGTTDATVRHAQVDDLPVAPTTSDAGESLCLHVRRPLPDVSRESKASPAGRLSLFFQYETVTQIPALEAAPLGRLGIPIPVPLFSHEIVKMTCVVHEDQLASPLAISAPAFDFVTQRRGGGSSSSNTDGDAGYDGARALLQKFSVPALTPLDVMVVCPSAKEQARLRHAKSRLASVWSGWLRSLVLALAVLLILSMWAAMHNQALEMESLHAKVEQLGLATNVDFREGTWSADGELGGMPDGFTAGSRFAYGGLKSLEAYAADGKDDGSGRGADAAGSELDTDGSEDEDGALDAHTATSAKPLRRPRPDDTASALLPPRSFSPGAYKYTTTEGLLRALAWPLFAIGKGASLFLKMANRVLLLG